MRTIPVALALVVAVQGWMAGLSNAQSVGFIEKFALAEDRAKALADLIPGSEEFFFYHCLDFQNQGKLPEAQGMLTKWASTLPLTPLLQQMQTRQKLLSYSTNPDDVLNYLRQELGLQFNQAPPQADRAKDLATSLDQAILNSKAQLDQALANNPGLEWVTDVGLLELLSRDLSLDQTRIVLQRLTRVDLPGLLPLIEKELRSIDSRGWGAFPIHRQLTLEQYQKLAKSNPKLLENDAFVRQHLLRFLPSEDVPSNDMVEKRAHLQRLEDFTNTLPPSQNNLKGAVLYQRLLLDGAEENFDRSRFEKYLSLPRQQGYYNQELLRRDVVTPRIEFNANYQAETRFAPINDDSSLVRRYLEHFLKTEETVDRFAKWLDRGFLESILIETKILYGIGNSSTWYAKLNPQQQRELKDRVELRFTESSQVFYQPSDSVKLTVDIKNVPKLIVRIYQLNPRNIYRKQGRGPSTDVDLDGLVANAEQTLEYAIPADRRHRESIPLPQCEGRGVWVIDLLGGGLRSRAMVMKGQLRSTQLLTDAGHEFRIYDESGKAVPSASIELGTRTFTANESGSILIPYGEQDATVPILLVDGNAATVELFTHRRESYVLEMGALMDSQNLLSGSKGSLIIRPQLLCNGQPMPISNLEEVQLTIVTADQEGIQSTQVVDSFKLSNDAEATHQFLVPQRFRSLTVTLSGKILATSRNTREPLSISKTIQVNDVGLTSQNADIYLIEDSQGYRLQVRGRNGEPIARLPVTIQAWIDVVNLPIGAAVATDAQGEIHLGKLANVHSVRASAEGMLDRQFSIRRSVTEWPARIQVAAGEGFELPWASSPSPLAATEWTLSEVRGGLVFADHNKKVSLRDNRLMIAGLDAGQYYLTNHRSGSVVEIRSAKGQKQDGFIVGGSQSLQASRPSVASVIVSEIKDGKLRIRLGGFDPSTRLHLVATTFLEDTELASRLRLTSGGLFRQPHTMNPSFYINSLKLDEEYQYILQRQYATKFPGNMLAQPSLLLNPWDTVTTENQLRQAAAGDAPPPSPAAPMAADPMIAGSAKGGFGIPNAGKSFFEFLGKNAILLANRRPDKDGWIEIKVDGLTGYHTLTAIVVDADGIATRTIPMPESKYELTELRLTNAFPKDKHLSKQQQARVIPSNVKTILGDARSTRIQTYSTINDVFRLYQTLLPNPDLEKFRVLTRWNKLKPEEKERTYSELACHEVHLFLYMKDRPFFDRVVKPYLEDKYQSQVMDRYLLGQDLDSYRDLWQRNRLNMFERIALAERLEGIRGGVRKSINDMALANPTPVELRIQRFKAALASSGMDISNATARFGVMGPAFGTQGGAGGVDFFSDNGALFDRAESKQVEELSLGGEMEQLEELSAVEEKSAKKETWEAKDKAYSYRSRRRLSEATGKPFFQSLSATREWAESQYYRTRISDQGLPQIPAGSLWVDLSKRDNLDAFLSPEFYLSNRTLTEALVSLAVLDLPFEATDVKLDVEAGQWTIQSPTPCVVFVESISESKEEAQVANVLVGQDLYLVTPGQAANAGIVDPQAPLTGQALVRGVGYRANVVVTNPNSVAKSFSILLQVPQGAIPLEGGKFVDSREIRLEPYTTQQLQYSFYFPSEGEFDHYGAQASIEGIHAASAPSTKLKVLNAPEAQATNTWAYISLWGTNQQVLDFLAKSNVQLLDLNQIAFRMHDKAFFTKCTTELDSQGVFHDTLWSYAILHKEPKRIAEYLSHRQDLIARMGPILKSAIVDIDSWNRYDYEHLDYRPLVNARSHQLGAERTILNDRMKTQYQRLISRIAYQSKPSNEDRLALTYYFIVQGRIDEALASFDAVQVESLNERLQYDYFDAYLDFYRGRYDRAGEIAEKYREYGVTRWRDLFSQVRLQVQQRKAMIDGTQPPVSDTAASDLTDPIQRILIDARQAMQGNLAADTPAIDLVLRDGKLVLNHQKVKSINIRYYIMDIELLFSRNPFVQQEGGALMAIQPNRSEVLELGKEIGKREIAIPADLANRNLLVEVTSGALTQSQVLYANSMEVTLVDSYGRLQVRTTEGQPVEKVYVKVYARHQGGQVQFFKDGYTDLRGQFDYASLSTNDLNTVERFAILILHPEKGAMIREVAPPKR